MGREEGRGCQKVREMVGSRVFSLCSRHLFYFPGLRSPWEKIVL